VLTIHQDHYRDKLNFQGYQKCNEKDLRELLALNQSKYIPRIEAEVLDEYKQVVTYVLVTHGDEILSFRRGSYSKAASFLRGSRCIGFGGHVTEQDYSLFSQSDLGVRANAVRELSEELVIPVPRGTEREVSPLSHSDFRLRGLINDDSSDVGRRHVGIVLEYKIKIWHFGSILTVAKHRLISFTG
jgi:predicted NUDIX family phosphoesterase